MHLRNKFFTLERKNLVTRKPQQRSKMAKKKFYTVRSVKNSSSALVLNTERQPRIVPGKKKMMQYFAWTRMPFWNASLSMRIKRYLLRHFKIP